MTNAVYVKAAERMLAAALQNTPPVTGTLKAALVKNTYVQNLSVDEFFTTISAHVIGTPQALASITITGGKLDAADPTVPSVAVGNVIEAVVLYMDTGNPATSWLFAYLDQINGFPYTTDGGNVVPQWDNGTYKIVSLV